MGNLFTRSRRPSQNFTNVAAVGIPVAEAVTSPMAIDNAPNANAQPNENAPLTLTVSGEKAALSSTIEHKFLAMLSLKAPSAPDDVERPPMDLVACIDRSGSMRGEKMSLMKKTLELLVTRAGLRADDRISLVTFDSNVKLDMPLTGMDSTGRATAESIVKGVQPGSTTNLSGGALKSIDVLDASASSGVLKAAPERRTRAVMLFTDGLANEGIREPQQLQNAVNNALAAASVKLGGPLALYTFGFGADHNEDCLRALATGSAAAQGSVYYYVRTAEDIPNAFADCLGGLSSVVAQNATLTLEPMGGVAVSRVLGKTYQRDADGAVVLGDLFAEDEKDVLLELTLPKLPSPADAAPILTASLRAFNVAKSSTEVVSATLSLARPAETPSEQPANELLDAQKNRIETAEAIDEASRLADAGQLDAGRQLLNLQCMRIADSASANNTLSKDLLRESEQLMRNYESTQQYRSVGSKMSKMSAHSHAIQRSTHCSSAYAGGAKRKAAMKKSWGLSMSTPSGDGSDSD